MPVELAPRDVASEVLADRAYGSLPSDGQHDGRAWGQGGDLIIGHDFDAGHSVAGRRRWRLCVVCGMAEAAHAGALTPYRPVQP